jgi:hypothetical protein
MDLARAAAKGIGHSDHWTRAAHTGHTRAACTGWHPLQGSRRRGRVVLGRQHPRRVWGCGVVLVIGRRRVRGGWRWRSRRSVLARARGRGRGVAQMRRRRPRMVGGWHVVKLERVLRWRCRRRRDRSRVHELRFGVNWVQQGFGLLLELVQGEGATEEDVLPPEEQEEKEVGAVHNFTERATSRTE